MIENVRADKAAIDVVTAEFFAAFATVSGTGPRVDALYDLFVSKAVIVNTAGVEAQIYDVPGFVEPRRAILTSGTFAEFNEWEVSESTEIFGNIAQRWSRYRKSWIESGRKREGGGTKSLQFVRTAGGWKIASLVWDDE